MTVLLELTEVHDHSEQTGGLYGVSCRPDYVHRNLLRSKPTTAWRHRRGVSERASDTFIRTRWCWKAFILLHLHPSHHHVTAFFFKPASVLLINTKHSSNSFFNKGAAEVERTAVLQLQSPSWKYCCSLFLELNTVCRPFKKYILIHVEDRLGAFIGF